VHKSLKEQSTALLATHFSNITLTFVSVSSNSSVKGLPTKILHAFLFPQFYIFHISVRQQEDSCCGYGRPYLILLSQF
jgi:hypothetical protein